MTPEQINQERLMGLRDFQESPEGLREEIADLREKLESAQAELAYDRWHVRALRAQATTEGGA